MCGLVGPVLGDIAVAETSLVYQKGAGCKQLVSWSAAKVPRHNKTSVMQIPLSALILSAIISSSSKLEIRKADMAKWVQSNGLPSHYEVWRKQTAKSHNMCASTAQPVQYTRTHTHTSRKSARSVVCRDSLG